MWERLTERPRGNDPSLRDLTNLEIFDTATEERWPVGRVLVAEDIERAPAFFASDNALNIA